MKRIPLILAVLSLAPVVAMFAAEANTSSVERRFQAIVVSADPARQTVRVRHKPTGFETDVVWDERSVVKVAKNIEVDDVPAGWVLCGIREADPARKAGARIDRLEPLAESKVPAKADEVKAKSTLRCKLARVPVTPEILQNHNRLLTRDKKLAYALDVDGELWAVEALYQMRPRLGREVSGTVTDLTPGMPCKELVYRQEPGRNRLISALLLPSKKNTIGDWTPTGPSGTQVEQLETARAKLRETHRQFAPELRRLMPVRFRLSPEVTLPGEPVTLSLEAWAQKTPNPEVTLDVSYLQPAVAQRRTLSLAWQAGESDDGLTKYTASLALPRLPIGQHCVTWTCDIGGDIPEFWRSFAVADSKTLVVMFHQTPGKVLPDYDELRLPYDHWEHNVKGRLLDAALTGKPLPASAKEWAARASSGEYRRRGASINQPASCMLKERTALPYPVHFSDEPEAVQKAYLQAMLELDGYCGFDSQDVGFISYEFGTRSVNVARQAGVRLIGAMCIHQNWMDGGGAGKINHTARPLRPYFAATDDFRKAGPGGRDALVLVSQHDKSLLWTEYGVGVFEPCWLEWGGLGGGGGRAEVFDEVFMSRHLDLFSAAIDNVANQRVPYFQSIGMEFTAVSKMVAESNALMIRYAVARARDGKVVFCHQAAAADFYRRHYQETPETLFYDPDYWCGANAASSVTGGWKPVDYPDLIQVENARYSAYFKKPAVLPEYHWDYTRPWNYPDWGNEELPRSPSGFLVPGEHDKFAVTPRITDTRNMKVSQSTSEIAAGLEVVVTLETTEAVKALPLALWDIPRDWKAGEGWWSTAGANRFVPIRAPYTGNLNGILEVDAQPGRNEYRLTITTPQRVPLSQDIRLETVHAKVFSRDGQTMAYVWPMQPWETAFELDVPTGKSVQYYAAPKGERVDLKPGKNRLVIAQERWSRIVGLSYEELAASLRSVEDAEKQEQLPPSDKRLLKNIDTLKSAVPSAKPLPAIDMLEAELANLWDWQEQSKRPLNPEIVFSAVKNGYKTEGIYINGYGDADGQDRVFFYYSRPESGDKKQPLYLDLTGGGEADRSAWIAVLCISPNFNHPDGCYGTIKYNPMDWLPYALGHETAYPAIASATQDGATYRVATQPGVTIQNATLYWSPGRDIVWPARYWLAVPAAFQDGVWQAEVPSRFAALERWAFMNARSDKGRIASSLPTFTAGVNPQETAGGWWPRGQLWDVEAGPGVWRPVGPNRHSGVAPKQVTKADAGGISIAPDSQRNNAVALVTSSVALACGEARARAGLRIELDAGAQSGELTVTLVRNFAAVQAQREFSCGVRYAAGVQRIEVPWSEFACAADPNAKLFPFDNLRLDGTRADGSALVLRGSMSF